MQRLQIFFTLYNLLLRSPLWNKLRMRTRFPSLIIAVIDLALDDQNNANQAKPKSLTTMTILSATTTVYIPNENKFNPNLTNLIFNQR